MPKRSNPFQQLVHLLNQVLAPAGVEVEESAFLTDTVSGKRREVDVVLRSTVGPTPVIVSIEVSDLRRKADVTWVEQRLAKHQTLPTSKLVFVTRVGYTPDALEKAKVGKADALTYDQALQVEWPLAMQLLDGGFFELIRYHYTCKAILGPDTEAKEIPVATLVRIPSQREQTTVKIMVETLLAMPQVKDRIREQVLKGERSFHFRYEQPGMSVGDTSFHQLVVEVKVEYASMPMNYEIGHLYGVDLMWGRAARGNPPLTVAFVKAGGKIQGRLQNAEGVQTLNIHVVKEPKG